MCKLDRIQAAIQGRAFQNASSGAENLVSKNSSFQMGGGMWGCSIVVGKYVGAVGGIHEEYFLLLSFFCINE